MDYIDVGVELPHHSSECFKVGKPSFDLPPEWLCLHRIFHETGTKEPT